MRGLSLALSAVALLSACGAAGSPLTRVVRVLAAASLSDSFRAEADAFQRAHPATRVELSFGASSTLAAQLLQGAPGDVLATADTTNMERVVQSGLVDASPGSPAVFAHNSLVIAVASGNPKRIAALADLARPGLAVVVCQPSVPCGGYAQQALSKAHVDLKPVSLEADVRAVLTKVELGEADAGMVYTTDVKAAGHRVSGVPIPDDQNVEAAYPIASLRAASDKGLARSFVDFVRSGPGRQILTGFGFIPA